MENCEIWLHGKKWCSCLAHAKASVEYWVLTLMLEKQATHTT